MALFISLIGSYLGCMGMEKAPKSLRTACEGDRSSDCEKLARIFWCTKQLAKPSSSRGTVLACQQLTAEHQVHKSLDGSCVYRMSEKGVFHDDGSPNENYEERVASCVVGIADSSSPAVLVDLTNQTLDRLDAIRKGKAIKKD